MAHLDDADQFGRPSPTDRGRRETRNERYDRNFTELLQELRVAQTGVQLLLAFLLTVAFTARFESADTFQRTVFMVTLLLTAAAIALLIAPVAYHRAVFRQQRKRELVFAADRLARGGLLLSLLAVIGVVLLVSDVVLGRPWSVVIAAGTGGWFFVFWYVVPFGVTRRVTRRREG